jgi:PAS domain S-box-containing protein
MTTALSHALRRRLSVARVLAAGGMLSAGLLAWWAAATTIAANEGVEHAHAAIARIADIRQATLIAQSEHRAFLITDDSTALASFRMAQTAVARALGRLQALLTDDAVGRQHAAQLVALNDTLLVVRERIASQNGQGVAAVRTAFVAPEAIAARRAVERRLVDLEAGSRSILAQRLSAEAVTTAWALAAILTSLLLAALFIWWELRYMARDVAAITGSERRHRTLIDENPDAVVVLTEARVVYANTAALILFGVPNHDALLGRDFCEFLHPEDREVGRQRIAEIGRRGIVTPPRIMRLRRGDGDEATAESRGIPIEFDGVRSVQLVYRDMHARMHAERQLTVSEQRHRALLDSMAEGVFLQDSSLAMQLWNPAAEQILGVSSDQLAGRVPFDSRWRVVDEHGRALPDDEQLAATALRSGQPASGILGVERGDGRRVWLRVSAVPLCHTGAARPYAVETTFSDITAERDAERRLAESERHYRLLADSTIDLISVRNRDHRYEYLSPSHQRTLGWREAELQGTCANDLMHPDDLVLFGTPVPGARDTKRHRHHRLRHRDGHYVWMESVTSVLTDAEGAVTGFQVEERDITERRALEDQLRQVQKSEALGRLANGVAHDFNNLFVIIRAAVDLLRDGATPAHVQHQILAETDLAIDRAVGLGGKLLAYGQGGHHAVGRATLATLIHQDHPVLQQVGGGSVSVRLTVDDGATDAIIDADATQVDRLLRSLVDNAREASAAGQSIGIHCGTALVSDMVRHRHGTIPPGRYATITVSDHGCGMPETVLERAFEPFFTTKSMGEGSGLGLSMAFGIVQQAGGSITIVSAPDQGSVVTVFWPVSQSRPARNVIAPSAAPAAAPAGEPNRRRAPVTARRAAPRHVRTADPDTPRPLLLIVDDEPGVRTMMTRLVERAGYDAIVAPCALDGISCARQHAARLAAIVSDVRMPGMSGVEMVAQLLSESIDLPVLFISGQLDTPLPTDWPATVARGFLGKPFAAVELTDTLDLLLQGRMAH